MFLYVHSFTNAIIVVHWLLYLWRQVLENKKNENLGENEKSESIC